MKELSKLQWVQRLGESFSLDLRSLALFRICLASVILIDLVSRSRDFGAFYTDSGVLSCRQAEAIFGKPLTWSFHLMSGATTVQVALFALAGFFAVLMLVGSQTRIATVASWVLLVSLHNRNPMNLHGGDYVLRHLLFWSMFLPLGACFSLDRSICPNPNRSLIILSAGTVGLTLQIFSIYFFSALAKTDASWLVDHTAVYYALRLENTAKPFGQWLTQFPDFLKIVTVTTLKFEFYAPLILIFISVRQFGRTFLVIAFIGFHIGLNLCLHLGMFGVICPLMWLALLPTRFWQIISVYKWIKINQSYTIFYDATCPFCLNMTRLVRTLLQIPVEWFKPAQSEPAIYILVQEHNSWIVVDSKGEQRYRFDGVIALLGVRPIFKPLQCVLSLRLSRSFGNLLYTWVANHRTTSGKIISTMSGRDPARRLPWYMEAIAGFFVLYVLLWNVRAIYPQSTVLFPRKVDFIAHLTRCDQRWNMFTPAPRHDGWFVMAAQLRDGSRVDLFRPHKKLSWRKPAFIYEEFSTDRWRYFLWKWKAPSNRRSRFEYAGYLRQQWNQVHPPSRRISRLRIYYFEETNLLNGEASEPRPRLLWNKIYPAK
jgi:predicted DCC family thiol-disulfide oxidoreductase YuxK